MQFPIWEAPALEKALQVQAKFVQGSTPLSQVQTLVSQIPVPRWKGPAAAAVPAKRMTRSIWPNRNVVGLAFTWKV